MSVSSVKEAGAAYMEYSAAKVTKKAPEKSVEKESAGVVYESSDIRKMSESERASLVSQLKADQANRQAQLADLVKDMISKQGSALGQAEDMWRFLASGDFTVDEETQKAAQEAISEDGYWGVKQTSQRIFDFAMALSGGDEEQMKKMQEAVEKGFKEATKAWGKELPGITEDTHKAVSELFENYYSKNTNSEQ